MIVDISARLRQIVLAGLPLVGASCSETSPLMVAGDSAAPPDPDAGNPTDGQSADTGPGPVDAGPDTATNPPDVAPDLLADLAIDTQIDVALPIDVAPPVDVSPDSSPACEWRTVYKVAPSSVGVPIPITFDPTDPRWVAAYAACTSVRHVCDQTCTAASCQELCMGVLQAQLMPSPGGTIYLQECAVGCVAGKPSAQVRYVQAVPGRRYEGASLEVPQAPGTCLGTWAAACAEAEAASVIAFRRLARELEAHDAPAGLVRRARQAARDEARHTALMAKLARRHGVRLRRPRVRPDLPVRSLEDMALENAVEGCVNETFAAGLALWQASTARDAGLRTTMAAIATDEAAHAQLAWDVDAWAARVLPATGAARVRQARTIAAAALAAHAGRPVDPALVREAGLPAAESAAWLAGQGQRELWAA